MLTDKFKIIENHTDNIKISLDNIDNFFINYIYSDIKIISHDYLQQLIWFTRNDDIKYLLYKKTICHIKNFVIEKKNNIRILIRKNAYDIINLNKLIKAYFNKIKYINNVLKFNSTNTSEKVVCPLENEQYILFNFIKVCILYLTEYIIFDPIISDFIENNIVKFIKSSHIKILIDTLLNYVIFDNHNLYISFVKKIGLIFFMDNLVGKDKFLIFVRQNKRNYVITI